MSSDAPRVLAVPDYRESNPYQAALADGLASEGIDVAHRNGRGLLFPVTAAWLAADRPPVVHAHFVAPLMLVHGDRYESFGVAGLLSVLLGVRLLVDLTLTALLADRLVWTAHDLQNHETNAPRTERAVKHALVRWLADTVIVHCDRAKSILRATFRLPESATDRMVTVPHGHFLDAYPDELTERAARRKLGLPADATVVAYFGLIRPYKNVPRLIETVRALDRSDTHLLIAGNPRSAEMRRQVEAAAADAPRTHLALRFVPDEAIQTYLRAADVVALPFRTERRTVLTSGSAILAMGYANPIVTPRVGCLPPLLGDSATDGGTAETTRAPYRGVARVPGGVLYDRNEQLADALRTALAADTQSMGRRNRRTVEQLDWETIATRTARIYRE